MLLIGSGSSGSRPVRIYALFIALTSPGIEFSRAFSRLRFSGLESGNLLYICLHAASSNVPSNAPPATTSSARSLRAAPFLNFNASFT